VGVDRCSVGSVRLSRVGYVDIEIEPAVLGLTPERVIAIEWAAPTWATAGGQLRVGAAAWVIEDGDARIVVDPAQAADDILRSDADAATHQETITHAIATHIDGIGMFAWRDDDGTWSPFFPNAPLFLQQREIDAIDRGEYRPAGVEALAALRAAGVVQPVAADMHAITAHVSVEFTSGHSQGHQVVRITDGDDHAVMLGHLATTAVHLVTGVCEAVNFFPDVAHDALERLRAEGGTLIGPLWPAPGAGRFDGERFVALGEPSSA
jgi:glyoxylase-like metal-dependent hydrolase (beta-lactamase superfamily II)